MSAYLLLLMAATPQVPMPAEPSAEQIEKWCRDGTLSRTDKRCPLKSVPVIKAVQMAPAPMPNKSQLARPKSNPGFWVSTNDYPPAALRMMEEGVVGFRLTIGTDGRVSRCEVTQSSGSATLDEATCRLLPARALFEPARDGNGKLTKGSYSNRVRWVIPVGPSYAFQIDLPETGAQPRFGSYFEIDERDYPLKALEAGMQGMTQIGLALSGNGNVTQCTIETSSGHELLDAKSCEIAKGWRFVPIVGARKINAGSKTRHQFRWELPDAWRLYQKTGNYPPKSY